MIDKTDLIQEVPDEIFKAAEAGKLVVFVGAGVSRLAGCPSWDALAKRILKEVFDRGWLSHYEYAKLEEYEAKKLISICWNILKEKNYDSTQFKKLLSTQLKHNNNLKVFEYLYRFKAIYVTTNLDECLDDVAIKLYDDLFNDKIKSSLSQVNSEEADTIQKKTDKDEIIKYEPSNILISDLKPGYVVHLHGGIGHNNFNAEEVILTASQYLNHYQNKDHIPTLLNELFNKKTVLFVGYGLEEYELLDYLIKSAGDIKEGGRTHFVLTPIFRAGENLLKIERKHYFTDFNIEPIGYFIDNEKYYHALENVVKYLANKIGPISKPEKFIYKKPLVDEVLENES